MDFVFKLLTQEEWNRFERDGVFAGSEADLRDGYIHLSYAQQLQGTAEKHFAGLGALVLASLDKSALGPELKDEISRGGMLFPHLYRVMRHTDVIWHRPILPSEDGIPILPDAIFPPSA